MIVGTVLCYVVFFNIYEKFLLQLTVGLRLLLCVFLLVLNNAILFLCWCFCCIRFSFFRY